MAWTVIGHPGSIVGGLRALIVQSLHPLAMAGVAQHSHYRRRPLDRLYGTTRYVAATTFGDTATARAAAERVRKVHRKVRGTDPVTGQPYSAADPDTQLWVHSVEWHSFLAAYRALAGPLSAEQQDRYIAEGARVAALLNVPPERHPRSLAEMRRYFASVRPQLRSSKWAREAIGFVVNPPLTRELLPYQAPIRVLSRAALALVPDDLRELAGIGGPAGLDAIALRAVRPGLAALALPGVREAWSLVVGPEAHKLAKHALQHREDAQRATGPALAA